jgi:hypothetical protein
MKIMRTNTVFNRFFLLLIAVLLAAPVHPVSADAAPARYQPATDTIGLVASANYQADNLTMDDHYLYPTFSSLSVVDLNPESLKLFQKFRTDYIFDLAVRGQYAYASQQDKGLRVFDITVATPTIFSSHDVNGGAFGLALAGDSLLIASGLNGLTLLDTTKPYDMPVISQVALDGFSRQVSIDRKLALVAAGKEGVHVVDISNPQTPWKVSTITTPDPAENVTLVGTIAYISLSKGRLEIVDVKDPAKPEALTEIATNDTLRRVVVKDGLAYLCEKSAGIRILDVADPKNPTPLAVYNTYGGAWDVAVKDNNIYVADYPYGLLVLRYNRPVEAAIPAEGGSLTSPVDNVQVTVKADSFGSAVDFRHEPLPAINTPIGPEPTLVKAGQFFRNSAWKGDEASKLANPYLLTVKVDVTGLTERQIKALSLYYWDTDLKRWREEVSTRSNVETATLTAETMRMGLWGVFYDREDTYTNIPSVP